MSEALAECKQVTRELHETVKDAHQLKKDLEKLLTNDAEMMVVHVMHLLLPSAINSAEEKAADELAKLHKLVEKNLIKAVKDAAKKMTQRDDQIKDLAESTLKLQEVMNQVLDMEGDAKTNRPTE